MNSTIHAQSRQQQRGISREIAAIIEHNGRCELAPGGAVRYVFGNREYQERISELKRRQQLLEKAKGGVLVVKGDTLITVYRAKYNPKGR